uniref:phosphatidylinositol 3-kinase n=1 Tax=Albugo laibachii Nc14 TaxID=890382 RepID=F0W0F7_9STRA|nr:phosphatidylinositol kinase putative [Albugo laibachii Nc14]|eukprot:CCA14529.1 phosphatidylinositol kinase putative [Albugo laibachii Nc14]
MTFSLPSRNKRGKSAEISAKEDEESIYETPIPDSDSSLHQSSSAYSTSKEYVNVSISSHSAHISEPDTQQNFSFGRTERSATRQILRYPSISEPQPHEASLRAEKSTGDARSKTSLHFYANIRTGKGNHTYLRSTRLRTTTSRNAANLIRSSVFTGRQTASNKSTLITSAAEVNHECLSRSDSFEMSHELPPFEVLNPYADVPVLARIKSASETSNSVSAGMSLSEESAAEVLTGDTDWDAVPGLIQSKESKAFMVALSHILKHIHLEISPRELEVRASTPQYLVSIDNPPINPAKKTSLSYIQAVARVPTDLIVVNRIYQDSTDCENHTSSLTSHEDHMPVISGYLRKRGGTNKSYRRRYMELKDRTLSYYKKKPSHRLPSDKQEAYLRGSIDLENVSSLQPMDPKVEKYGIVLVTTSRTWELVAEEKEYHKWLKEFCQAVKFQAVHVDFKRMFELQEVSAKAITDVRISIPSQYTVGEAVGHIFSCYQHAVDAAPLKAFDPNAYALKITGFRDYLLDRERTLMEYMHVRECFITSKTVRLTLIATSLIQQMIVENAAISSIKATILGRTTMIHHGQPSEMVLDSILYYTHNEGGKQRQHAEDFESPEILRESKESMEEVILSENLHEPLSLCLYRIMNVPRLLSSRKRLSEHSEIEYKPLTATRVVVRAGLYDGGKLLHNSVVESDEVTLRVQKDNLMWAEWSEPIWLHFGIKISDIPRTVRIMLTVLGIKDATRMGNLATSSSSDDCAEEIERILVTGVNVFEIDDLLLQGPRYLAMYSNLYNCNVGPVPHIVMPEDPVLQIEFGTFDRGVKFHWTSEIGSEISTNADSTPKLIRTESSYEDRKIILHKEGWLHKLGYTRWTRWRRRWFVLDHETCTLTYSDDRNVVRKSIPLRNCLVVAADDMNEKYTTAPVNKGTRKERQTYCFKVRPSESSREYIISAETKQERAEWMLAIITVSKWDGDHSEASGYPNISKFVQSVKTELARHLLPQFSPDASQKPEESASLENSSTNELSGNAKRPLDTSIDHVEQKADHTDGKGRGLLGSFKNWLQDAAVGDDDAEQSDIDPQILELRRIISLDPLYRPNAYQKTQMWSHRDAFMDLPEALPRILSCVNWGHKVEIQEALDLLPLWSAPTHKAAYIGLLDGEFAHPKLRSFAVSKVAEMPDTTLSYYVPQLVQALKFENHHLCPLATLLIERAIRNPNQIGFDLFWSMKVESHNEQYRERYGVLLSGYLAVCSQKMRAILQLQDKVFSFGGLLDQICQQIKARKKEGWDEMRRVMQEQLAILNETLPLSFQLPLDPRIEVRKIIIDKCRILDSAKKPLWLVFENAEAGGDPVTIIFKAGDDVRQDCLTLQLIRLMDEMWRAECLDLAMEPYRCVATSPMTGVLQVVPNSVTTAEIHKRVGILGAFKDPSFSSWIQANNPDPKSHQEAVDLFLRSCAGYCVATCALGIGDRHNDNIMISTSGRYFHIDFGHFLGHFKYQLGLKRERTPFVFTKEMAHVLGGTESIEFKKFVETSCKAYCVLRKHVHLLVALLLLMIPADMPELTGRDDINHLVTALAPELSEEAARESFAHAIHFCLDDKFKRIDNTIHILAHLMS